MFNWFSGKKRVDEINEETKKGFDLVKKDINHVGEWIKHLDSEKKNHKKEIDEIRNSLSSIKEELDEIRSVIFLNQSLKTNRVFKTPKPVLNKQTAVYDVQTGVQTGVQTPIFDHFSNSEKAILWILLNTDMKLSYEDIAVIVGKEKATIRGQINSIKQKGEIIEESIEKNGKKRVFIPENIREKLLKTAKVRVKSTGKRRKSTKK